MPTPGSGCPWIGMPLVSEPPVRDDAGLECPWVGMPWFGSLQFGMPPGWDRSALGYLNASSLGMP